MTQRIPAVIEMIRALNAAGVAAPPKPFVGFPCDLFDGGQPTSPQRALDPEYQRQLDVWVSQVEYLHRRHIGQRGD
ncbi:MAG: hypothetical protein EOP82_07425 [Variovorax sp.]|nr:MAG: hypothetical protein EOP82_07425 [Variovorax sp.]